MCAPGQPLGDILRLGSLKFTFILIISLSEQHESNANQAIIMSDCSYIIQTWQRELLRMNTARKERAKERKKERTREREKERKKERKERKKDKLLYSDPYSNTTFDLNPCSQCLYTCADDNVTSRAPSSLP